MWKLILCVNLAQLKNSIKLVKHYYWVCLWGCRQTRSAFDSVDCEKDCRHQCYWASRNPLRVQVAQNGGCRANLLWLLEQRHPHPPTLRIVLMVARLSVSDLDSHPHLHLLTISISFSDLWMRTYCIGSPSSQAFRLRLNYTIGSLVLHLIDNKAWDLLASIMSKFLY